MTPLSLLSDLLIPFIISLVVWLLGGVTSPPSAPEEDPNPRAFGVFVLTLLCWLGWMIALITLAKLGPGFPLPAPAALIAVAGAAGGALGLKLSFRFNPR